MTKAARLAFEAEVRQAGIAALDVFERLGKIDAEHLLGLMTFVAGGAVAVGKTPQEVVAYLTEVLSSSEAAELRAGMRRKVDA